ncbi:MAG: hypothetical protein ABIH01_04930 [Candidatus Omnitrophota bacterium]
MRKTAAVILIMLGVFCLAVSNVFAEQGEKFFSASKKFSDGKRLYFVEAFSNRVLINACSQTDDIINPVVVIGQTDPAKSIPNSDGVSARSLCSPSSAITDGDILAIADTGNSRVLIYNSIPTSNYAAADVVLGQPDFTSNLPNSGGINASSMYFPKEIFYDGRKFYVSDTFNNRVLIYNSLPSKNFQPADIVLGQVNFESNAPNPSGPDAASLCFPAGVFGDGMCLFVADEFNHRVKFYNDVPKYNNAPCNAVIGQVEFTSNEPNQGKMTPSATSLHSPNSISFDSSGLYVSDFGNNRILVYERFPRQNGQVANAVLGQSGFTTR